MAPPRLAVSTSHTMLCLLFASSAILPAVAAPKQTAEQLFQRTLVENETVLGRNAALMHINQALAMDSNNALYWRQKGAILGNMDEYEQALPCLEKSLKLNPKDVTTWNGYSTTLSNLKRYPEALTAADQALKVDHHYPFSHITKSAVLFKLSRFAEAEKELDIVIQLAPENLMGRIRRPAVSTRLGHWDKVIEDTTILIPQTKPGTALVELYEMRAHAYTQKKLYDKAVADYKLGLKLHPDMRQLHDGLRTAYKLKGDAAGVRTETAEIEALDEDFRPSK